MIDNTPIQYQNHSAEFLNHRFFVDKRVLIPRIESEDIVRFGIEFLNNNNISHPTIIDIGTGSGCLGISLAHYLQKHNQNYSLFLSDISPKSLEVAKMNVEKILENPSNIYFQQSDLFKSLPRISYDLVLANLPYIPSKNIPNLDPSVKDFEPHLALDGGPDGSILINKLLSQLPQYISTQGLAILEFDDTQTIKNFHIPKNLSCSIKKDCFGVDRFLLASLG